MSSEDVGGPTCAAHPYRGDTVGDRTRVERLERENGRLRALIVGLAFALFVVAGAAGYWLSTLSHVIRP